MAQITTYDGTPVTDAIVIGPDGQPGYSQTATLGTPGFSQVIVDDPDGSLTFETWKDWTVDEDDCTFERLYTGIVFSKRVVRGPYRDGPGRQWQLEIVDLGQLLYQRAISGDDGNRPEEDDTERVDWLMNSDYLDGIVFDNGFVNVTDNPQNFFDADYRGQYPMDVLVSIAAPISKYAFVYWDEVAEQPSLFYDRWNVDLGDAGIGFSNVIADVDEATVFYPKVDAEASYVGEDRYGGIMVVSRVPTVYATSPTTIAAMGRTRDSVFQTDRIGRSATAANVAQLLLQQHADDLVSITFSAELPSSVVNLARPGQRMEVRFSHIPGFETTQEVFIRSTIVQQMQAGRYLVQYDVAPDPAVPLVPTGGDPGELPHQPCEATLIQFKFDYDPIGNPTITLDAAPTPGHLMCMWIFGPDDPETDPVVTGWTQLEQTIAYEDVIGNDYGSMWYRIAEPGDPSTYDLTFADQSWIAVAEFEGVGDLITSDFVNLGGGITSGVPFSVGTVVASSQCVLISLGGYGDNNPPSRPLAPVASTVIFNTVTGVPWWSTAWRTVEAGTYNEQYVYTGGGTEDGHAGIVALFELGGAGGSGCCPATGQWVENEVVVLTGADGTTACPFADDSLHVYIDNVEQTATLVSQDGETGDFTLGFDPTPTEVCTVMYQGR